MRAATRGEAGSPPPGHRSGGRRYARFILVALAAVMAASVVWLARRWLPAPASSDPGPVVLISIDSLRADRLPAYGYRGVRTPAIDALVSDGILFEAAFAHIPQTLPSHVSILSGLLPFEHGVRDEVGFLVGPRVRLLQERLGQAGFATGGIVSSFLLRNETGVGRGFDWFADPGPDPAPDEPVTRLHRDGLASLALARQWLAARASPRFFLFFHIDEPRVPHTPPARHSGPVPYDGEVAYSDEIVGGLLATLRERGWYDRSTIVLLADHGEALGDHGEQRHGLFLYAETMRVPLVVKLPQNVGGGRRVKTPAQHIDLVPTILDLIGAPPPGDLRGRSLKPVLESPRGLIADQAVYGESLYARYHFGWSELTSLTDDEYRFIKAPRPELYDRREDPGDRQDVIGVHALTSAAMRNALDSLLAGAAIPEPGLVSADDLQCFQALGLPVMFAGVSADVAGETLADPKDHAGSADQRSREGRAREAGAAKAGARLPQGEEERARTKR